jgi:hypothetical protein
MKQADYVRLYLIGLAVMLIAAVLMQVPGYMDAEYYYSGGLQLYHGKGFNDPFLWNYLDDPAGIPHPSHTYWMPLPSIVAAAGMWLRRSDSFLAARHLFILIAAGVPVLAALIAQRLGQSRKNCWMAGLLAVFCGFYAVYLTDTETFALYMTLGSLFLLCAFPARKVASRELLTRAVGVGFLAGAMHLTRADGILWLGAGVLAVLYQTWKADAPDIATSSRFRKGLVALVLLAVGYCVVMGPWYIRNLNLYGTLMTSGSNRTMWLTNYDETFIYPASNLTFEHWLQSGIGAMVKARLDALGMNLKNMLAVEGLIFLLPFMAAGLWKLRNDPLVWAGTGLWLITLAIMTVVFPFAGSRGGFIHSGSAFQILLWAVTPAGLDSAIGLGVRLRNWHPIQSKNFFSGGLVLLSAIFTGVIFYQVVVGSDLSGKTWRRSQDQMSNVWVGMQRLGVRAGERVMANNPPEFYLASGQECMPVPYSNFNGLFEAANRYDAKYMILDKNYVDGLKELYEHPGDIQGLKYLDTIEGFRIYRFLSGGQSG